VLCGVTKEKTAKCRTIKKNKEVRMKYKTEYKRIKKNPGRGKIMI
jgi:hypothetical protein